jgi:hypothetical protein
MASGAALGKANETSGLTEPARYSIYRMDAHAEKPTGDPVWLNHGAESWLLKLGDPSCRVPTELQTCPSEAGPNLEGSSAMVVMRPRGSPAS